MSKGTSYQNQQLDIETDISDFGLRSKSSVFYEEEKNVFRSQGTGSQNPEEDDIDDLLDSDNDEKPPRNSSQTINQDICSNKSEDHKTLKIAEKEGNQIDDSPFAGTISKSGVEELENML